jgi:predicted flavoprotein YhiN
MKGLRCGIARHLGYEKAEVTSGGVDLREVDSRSMVSLKHPALFLAGEILDLDGPIGGYNFQAAWSTGWLAGTRAAARAAECSK